jgi:NAD(P)-dependent dehydrogenase (short-subunit alcohol dehydrogenase family)
MASTSIVSAVVNPLVFPLVLRTPVIAAALFRKVAAPRQPIPKLAPYRRRTFATMANPHPFSGKVITITGAARGIGLATAKYLAARGATVSLTDVLRPDLESAEEEIIKEITKTSSKGSVTHAVVDVSKREDVDEWIKKTKETYGRIDGCVNNAGVVGATKPIPQLTDEEWHHVLNINLGGVFNCLRAQLPIMEDGGSIVNVSSVAGLYGFPEMSPYVVSKHGMIGLTKCAAKEVGARGIRVNAICPGAINTPMIHQANDQTTMDLREEALPQLFKRYGRPEEIAALIAYLLGDESKFTTCSAYTIDGGWSS